MSTDHILLTGNKMPSIGLGTGGLKDPVQLKLSLNTALEIGYRHVDTAFVYENEEAIGEVLNEWLSSGKLQRKDLFVTTKLPFKCTNSESVEKYMKTSLKSLQLQYVDLYLIHWPYIERKDEKTGTTIQEETDHIAIWKKMEEQVHSGRTRAIGLSNFNITQIERIWNSVDLKPVCLQIRVQLYWQQNELVEFCKKKGIVVTGYSSLKASKIDGKLKHVFADQTVNEIAKKHNVSAAQVILRYFLQNNIIMIPRSATPSRIKENFDLFTFSLDEADVQSLCKLDSQAI